MIAIQPRMGNPQPLDPPMIDPPQPPTITPPAPPTIDPPRPPEINPPTQPPSIDPPQPPTIDPPKPPEIPLAPLTEQSSEAPPDGAPIPHAPVQPNIPPMQPNLT